MKKVVRKLRPAPKYRMTLAVLFIIIAGSIAYYHHHKAQTTSNIIAAIENQTRSSYPNIAVTSSVWVAQMGSGVGLTAPGYAFAVSSQAMPSVYFGVSTDQGVVVAGRPAYASSPDKIATIVSSVMHQAGYRPVAATNVSVYYKNAQNTCLYSYDPQQVIVTLSCYSDTTIRENAKEAQPFVTAYSAANPAVNPKSIIFGPLVIKSHYGGGVIGSSHAADYDIAEAVITNDATKKLVLYYHKGNGPWHFITQANDEYGFKCADYMATPEVRKVMYDQICLGAQGQVRLDTTNRALR